MVAALVCGGLAEDGVVGVQNRLAVALVGRIELKARLVRGQLDWGLGLAAPPHTTDLGRCSAGQTWLRDRDGSPRGTPARTLLWRGGLQRWLSKLWLSKLWRS